MPLLFRVLLGRHLGLAPILLMAACILTPLPAHAISAVDPDLCEDEDGNIGLCADIGGRSLFGDSGGGGGREWGYTAFDQSRPSGSGPATAAYVAAAQLMKVGDQAAAETRYRQAISLDPQFAEAWNNLGFVLAGANRFEEALAAFEEAVRLKPDYRSAMENFQIVQRHLGIEPR